MTSIGSTTRPAYFYDSATDTWIPVGPGTHAHTEYSETSHTHSSYATKTGSETLTNKTLTAPIVNFSINQQASSYTLVLSDASQMVEIGSSATLTVPLNSSQAFPVGTSINILQTSTGQVTIAGASGVTVNATPGLKLRAQWSMATLIKRATDTWVLSGDLVA